MLNKEVPLGTLVQPQQVADWVAWLASEKSAFATGSIYRLDGEQMRS
jgi:NAD(P)-dependent dehydrogenase (short-subunit alcohol dehydrogenase family)